MTTYFSSDLHVGHVRICELAGRPFASVTEMNEQLVFNWNDTVGDEDLVWVLGDAAMGSIAESLAVCSQLQGRKILLCGNHDRAWAGWQQHRPGKVQDWHKRYIEEGGFDVVLDGRSTPALSITGTDGAAVSIRASHFPYEGDHTAEERYSNWRPEDDGGWLLHGHVHEMWRIRGRQINVGVDVWNFRPVSETTLADIILGHQVDTTVATV